MSIEEGRRKGGYAASQVVRLKHLNKYLEDPRYCIRCGKMIEKTPNRNYATMKKMKFCGRECSFLYRKEQKQNNKEKKIKEKKIKFLGNPNYYYGIKDILFNKTKGQLFEENSLWNARSKIGANARRVMIASLQENVCKNCNYSLHVEVCHIKPLSSFSNDIFIWEINNPNNLVYLCPNCHWEFDHELLVLSDT